MGLILVGITESEPHKKVTAADGSLIELSESAVFKVQPLHRVVKAIMRNIRKRKFRSTLTGIGRSLSVVQSIMPGFVEKLMVYSFNKNVGRTINV